MIFFGEKSLRNTVATFLEHFHMERNHQGLANRAIEPGEEVGLRDGDVLCRERSAVCYGTTIVGLHEGSCSNVFLQVVRTARICDSYIT